MEVQSGTADSVDVAPTPRWKPNQATSETWVEMEDQAFDRSIGWRATARRGCFTVIARESP